MKRLALLFSLILVSSALCLAQTTAVTYQGKLSTGGAAATGDYQFEFKLFDADLGGNQVGSTQTAVASVQNGVFTTRLDFGANSFPADADRWLEISVRSNGSTDPYTTLNPRQQLNSVPYAVRSLRATDADNAASLGGVTSGNFVQTTDARLSDARPPAPGSGDYIQNRLSPQQAANFSINGNGTIGGSLTARFLIGDGSGLTNIHVKFPWQVVAVGAVQAQPNTGYVVTNPTQATITLPDNPIVGDVVRVTAAATGGWKIVQNTGQSILTSSFGLVGSNWTAHESTREWSTIASSADGSKLVAAATGGSINTSSDGGLTWTPTSAGDRPWSAVASSADGVNLVAVTGSGRKGNGQIYTSADSGATWTARESTRVWASVASSSDGSKLVAVVSGGRIYVSTDSGVSWTPYESSRDWTSVASSSDGTKLVAVVGGGHIYVSTNGGSSWTQSGIQNVWRSVTSSSDGSKLVAVAASDGRKGTPYIYTSTDGGSSWTQRESAREWSAVASSADGNKLIAAVTSGRLYISNDSGVTWSASETDRLWTAVTSSADGNRLAAVASPGQIYTSVGSSSSTTTLGTAGSLVGGQSTAIELQYIGNGLWLPISHEGTIVGN